MDMFIAASRTALRRDKASRTLARALRRYDRRADAYTTADPYAPLWVRQAGPSAMALVKQARDLAGRLEAMVYEGVGL